VVPASPFLDLWGRLRLLTRACDLKLQPLFSLRTALRVQNRLARLRVDDQRILVASLEWLGEANLVLKVVAFGRVIVRHQRAIHFVKDPDPIIVNRKVGGEFKQKRGFDLGPRAAIEVDGLHSAIRKLMENGENQSLAGKGLITIQRHTGGPGVRLGERNFLATSSDQRDQQCPFFGA
jgi:hypothetical protein